MTLTIDEILTLVEKPSRYVGAEFNMPDMDKPCDVRVCMCFPEIYEIGMSNIGLRILYHMLNDTEGVVSERCFAPKNDMSELMRENGIKLFSLETRRKLTEFDIVGFSIGYEMLYTNVLYMFDLAGIPFYASERGEEYPLIIAGGPCAVNPEPFAPYFDAIMIGEGEVNLDSFVKLYKEYKAKGITKVEFLRQASTFEGVYVPSLKSELNGRKVKKAIVKDLENAYFPTKILVPNIEITHDRAVLEIYRGCANGCRFCQAGFYYRPIRMRSADKLIEYGKELVSATGYDELSLASLSTGDYPELFKLIDGLKSSVCNGNVRLAMPSLRLDSFKSEYMRQGRMGSLTFAPEAGSERLRRVINKNITEDNIRDTITTAIDMGYNGFKLYFMLGLPTETADDVQGIVDIVKLINDMSHSGGRRKTLNINVSTSVFIPKPLTPFQWERQISLKEMEEKQRYLRDALRMKNVRYSWHDGKTSLIEAVLARGDERLAKVVESAYRSGAKFDGWSEHFNFELWENAFKDNGIAIEEYTREFTEDECLPWDYIDSGVDKDYLLKERHKAYREESTSACSDGKCMGCGALRLGKCYK